MGRPCRAAEAWLSHCPTFLKSCLTHCNCVQTRVQHVWFLELTEGTSVSISEYPEKWKWQNTLAVSLQQNGVGEGLRFLLFAFGGRQEVFLYQGETPALTLHTATSTPSCSWVGSLWLQRGCSKPPSLLPSSKGFSSLGNEHMTTKIKSASTDVLGLSFGLVCQASFLPLLHFQHSS